MASVDPAVDALHKFTSHPVRVVMAEAAVVDLAHIRLSDALGIDHVRDVWNAVDQRALRGRQNADGNVELIDKRGDLARPAIGPEVFEDLDGVAPLPVLGSEGIL